MVLTREPLLLLDSVLRRTEPLDRLERYRLAGDLIHGLRLPDSQVTEVILAQVISQVKAGQSGYRGHTGPGHQSGQGRSVRRTFIGHRGHTRKDFSQVSWEFGMWFHSG